MSWLAVSLALDGVLAAIGRVVPGPRRHRWRPADPGTIAVLAGGSIVGATLFLVPLLYLIASTSVRWTLPASLVPSYGLWVAAIVLAVRGGVDDDPIFGPWTLYRFGNWLFAVAMFAWVAYAMLWAMDAVFKTIFFL